jgi:hypothetical protein
MAKQYNLKKEDNTTPDAKPSSVKAAARPLTDVASAGNAPERRASDRGHAGQLLWSFAVAICLILAALLQWTAPKNALMEQDRAPAQIRFETVNTGLNGS